MEEGAQAEAPRVSGPGRGGTCPGCGRKPKTKLAKKRRNSQRNKQFNERVKDAKIVKGLKDSADVIDYLDRRAEQIGDYLVEHYEADIDAGYMDKEHIGILHFKQIFSQEILDVLLEELKDYTSLKLKVAKEAAKSGIAAADLTLQWVDINQCHNQVSYFKIDNDDISASNPSLFLNDKRRPQKRSSECLKEKQRQINCDSEEAALHLTNILLDKIIGRLWPKHKERKVILLKNKGGIRKRSWKKCKYHLDFKDNLVRDIM